LGIAGGPSWPLRADERIGSHVANISAQRIAEHVPPNALLRGPPAYGRRNRASAPHRLPRSAWVASESAAPETRPLGIARFIVSGDDKAEIAISIIDACQGKGLGRLLVGTLGCVAQARGLATASRAPCLREIPTRAAVTAAQRSRVPRTGTSPMPGSAR
jgi:GNAT superfamily N-acetyltransferase